MVKASLGLDFMNKMNIKNIKQYTSNSHSSIYTTI